MKFELEEIRSLQKSLPELPGERRKKYRDVFGLPDQYIEVLVSDTAASLFFEEAVKIGKPFNISAKIIADLMVNKRMHNNFDQPAEMVKKIVQLLRRNYASPEETKEAVLEIIKEEQKAVSDYKNGNAKVLGYLIGMVQKKLKGSGDVGLITRLLQESLA